MSNYINHKVKDIGLAEWGRREIKLAEAEMPGLMSLRKEFGKNKPLKGARIAGSIAHYFEKEIREVSKKINIDVMQIEKDPIDHLVNYHVK